MKSRNREICYSLKLLNVFNVIYILYDTPIVNIYTYICINVTKANSK